MYDQLGPAVNSGKSLFLYGAPGNGKTVVAEGIGRALGSDMYIPHAIDVDGQTITMFDPGQPRPHAAIAGASQSVIAAAVHDRRWEQIRRPVVVVGGELTLDMLDLTFNPIAKFYEAPIQMKANGGVFVVDDFGRQRIPPRDLLNRWIVPLESRVDFLTLHTGRKFEVPFNVFIIFATNLKPESLADEAFLRRIPYKIRAQNPTIDEYAQDLRAQSAGSAALPFDPVMVEYLQRKYYQPRKLQMRACHPRDLVEQVVDMCRYQQREPVDHARAARRGVRQLLPRGERLAGERSHEPGMSSRSPAEAAYARSDTRGSAGAAPSSAATRRPGGEDLHPDAVLGDGDAPGAGLRRDRATSPGCCSLASEALVVALTLVRRPAAVVDRTLEGARC